MHREKPGLKAIVSRPTMRWIGAKLIRMLAVVTAVSLLTFLALELLPGDVSYQMAGRLATDEEVAAIQSELGLNRPFIFRYAGWLAHMVSGDLGHSASTGEPVGAAILSRLPVTLELMILAPVLALALAVPAAFLGACRSGGAWDKALNSLAFASMSVPNFVMALMLIFLFALHLRWFPATGFVSWTAGPLANLKSIVLPAFSLALIEWVPFMRVLRSDLIATLQEDYILIARAKGLSTFRILTGHALRPSLFSLVTVLGLHLGHLIGGAIVVEWIFALPGMGRLLVSAIFAQDTHLVLSCIMLITAGYVLINFGVDMLYLVLDPRLRQDSGPEAS